MSNRYWLEKVQNNIAQVARGGKPLRLAIVGIGHPLRRDDAAGLAVVHKLRKIPDQPKYLMLVEAGPAPENFTGKLRTFLPDLVIIVDAADMARPPGWLELLEWRQVQTPAQANAVAPHRLPLQFFGAYLALELDCRVLLMGIQPKDILFGETLTDPVGQAVSELATALEELANTYCRANWEVPVSQAERIQSG